MDRCNIAVIGATGAVGKIFLQILEERQFPVDQIRLCASKRSFGKTLEVNLREVIIEEVTPKLLSEVDITFIAAGSDISHQVAPLAVEQGSFVVDKSSAFRMDPTVPLVVPEVNGFDIETHKGIVSTPNCSTTELVMALKPLDDANRINRVVVDTYQSVSGTGAAAVEELQMQSKQILSGESIQPSQYPHQIAFNVIPHIETFLPNGYTTEEMKMVDETRKIMHRPKLRISATCARVPVRVAHSEAVHIEFSNPITPPEIRDLLLVAPGIKVLDHPGDDLYPMPINAEGRDPVYVGRIRQDVSHPTGIAIWLTSDNLRKGAALNAIQIAEEALDKNLLAGK